MSSIRSRHQWARHQFRAARLAFIIPLALLAALVTVVAPEAFGATPTFRVNAGGPALSGSPSWAADTGGSPSQYVNAAAAGAKTASTTAAVTANGSVPAGTPSALFATERWDPPTGAEMQWNFPVTAGDYDVRLFFADTFTGTQTVGARKFDVSIEGALKLDDYDIFADVGGFTGTMKTFRVSSDTTLTIAFGHVVQNPLVRGIEIISANATVGQLAASPSQVSFPSVATGATSTAAVTLTNTATAGGPSIVVSGTGISGTDAAAFSDNFPDTSPVTLAPGASTTVTVTFAPTTAGTKTATLNVTHNGTNSPLAVALSGTAATATGTTTFRVNAGGPALSGSPSWAADTGGSPSQYVNAAAAGAKTASTTATVTANSSVPAGTPSALFTTERWDPGTGVEMQWNFPVTAGDYDVRLFFAETYTGTQNVGARKFDVSIEGALKLDDYDIFADVGGFTGTMKTFRVSSDTTLTIDFGHVVQNPIVNGIEIIPTSVTPGQLAASPSQVSFPSVAVGATTSAGVTLTNTATAGGPSIVVSGTGISGTDAAAFSDNFPDTSPVTLAPGASTTVTVTFAPTTAGTKTATLNVTHNGTNSPLAIALTGSTQSTSTFGFAKSVLAGETSSGITSLQFGPDGKLYVAQFSGLIKVYTVVRSAANSYSVTTTDTIDLVQKIPNYNDDGTPNISVKTRIITGLLVTGTAANPVIYATSSDPRIGGGSSGTDQNLDTNSSMLSRLAWSGTSWEKVDLVRGLPRSEENHSANGMQLDPATNTLYIAQGGNTNSGAPSNNFARLPEFALSAAVLSVNLNAIGNTTYDIPTLDDDSRSGAADGNDPFGGNNGKNQAKLVPGGPVQVYAPGFRNPYDLLRHSNGKLYTIDNGANAGWGDIPINEGPGGTCTNGINEPGTTDPDTLHAISGPGYYGGHPNPTRGNKANTFNANAQSPVSTANAIECDSVRPGSPEHKKLTSWPGSTNGIAEYTASNFNGAMKGNILAAGYSGNSVSRVVLDSTGGTATSNTVLFSTVGSRPLDITTQGDSGALPGTIWVGDQNDGAVYVFEPNDFSGGGNTCQGTDSTTLDEDNDGFSNADEIDSGTNPCSSADVPPDADNDKVSNLNDPDDDNDNQPDTSDPFAIDSSNGTTRAVPITYSWDNGAPEAGGLLGLGFTGLMTNGTTDYRTLYDESAMTAGGAAGVTTVDAVPAGTATGTSNNQQYAFQFGVSPPSGPFTAHSRVVAPFSGITPVGGQSMGLFIGTGGQNDFVKVVTTAGNGTTGIEVQKEIGGTTTTSPVAAVTLPGPDAVDLYLTIDPAASTVQASYAVTSGGAQGPRIAVGAPESIPASWLTTAGKGLAVGIISTSLGGTPFPATWDFIEVVPETTTPGTTTAETTTAETTTPETTTPETTTPPPDAGQWRTLASTGLNRQEVSYVKVGSKFYLAGGGTAHQAYDPATDTWASVAPLPKNLDHIQGVEVGGLIYYIGGLEAFPSPEVATVYIYNPATNTFSTGAPMPRGRGAGGVAVHNGKIYYAGGLNGGAAVPWFDVYDPVADTWSSLPVMPRIRDHFHAAVTGGKFYAIGGRNATINSMITANDHFDFATSKWVTGAAPLPTARGGFATVVLDSEVVVIGGEGGGKTYNNVEAYNPTTNTWRTLAPMLTARHGIQGVVCAGSVYIASGGKVQGQGPTSVHEAFSFEPPQPCTGGP